MITLLFSKLRNYQVEFLRNHKNFKKYCEPKVVSFGPIHHKCKPEYRLTEEYKLRLTAEFIKKSKKSIEELYDMIKKNIKKLRVYFDEEVTKKYCDEALAWMLFVDGCATLQFIHSINDKSIKEFKIKDHQVAYVQIDLFLLENQLPYQLLEDLMKNSAEEAKLRESIENFIDVHSMLCTTTKMPKDKEPIHLLDLLRRRLLGGKKDKTLDEDNKSGGSDWQSFRNVQELREAGICLKRSRSSCLGDISFTKKRNLCSGILCLPPITVDDSIGPKFFNLIAYEMCSDFENDYGVTSYIAFLDSLIDEAKDVMELRKAGILRNFLGSDGEVAELFNEICTDLVPNPELYRVVRCQIQEDYDNKWITWISQFYYTHFNSPWTTGALFAAVFALALSIAQTWYAVMSYEDSKKQNNEQNHANLKDKFI